MTDLREDLIEMIAELAAYNPSLLESIGILISAKDTKGRAYLEDRALEAVMDDSTRAMDMMPLSKVVDNVRRLCQHPEGREAFRRAMEKDPRGAEIMKAMLEADP